MTEPNIPEGVPESKPTVEDFKKAEEVWETIPSTEASNAEAEKILKDLPEPLDAAGSLKREA